MAGEARDKPLLYGGQAVIEGVMMRGPRHAAVAVRRADGAIQTTVEEAVPWLTRNPRWNRPILRGPIALWDSLRLGIWAMRWSARQAMEDALALEADRGTAGSRPGRLDVSQAGDTAVKGTMALGLLIGVALFIALPTLLTGLLKGRLDAFGLNLVEGVVRLALFFAYLALVGRMPNIRRVFEFHGAEHRIINALEDNAEMTPEVVRRYPVIHPRCGTSFAIFVLLLASAVYTLFGWHDAWYVRLGIRLALLPLVAGVAYELLRLAGRLRGNALMSVVTWPGRFTQRFTTREPDDSQAEVAIAALRAAQSASQTDAPVLV